MPLRVRVSDAFDTAAPLTHFVRVTLSPASDGMLDATLAGAQGSNLLRTMAVANALLVVPESINRVESGMLLDALLIPGSDFFAAVSGDSSRAQT